MSLYDFMNVLVIVTAINLQSEAPSCRGHSDVIKSEVRSGCVTICLYFYHRSWGCSEKADEADL